MQISHIPRHQLLTLLALGVSLALTALAAAQQPAGDEAKAAPAQEKAKPAASPAADGDYVGSAVCVTCHSDQERRFKNTIMGKVMANPRTPDEARGCEACHGPGRSHVEAGGGKDTIPIDRKSVV